MEEACISIFLNGWPGIWHSIFLVLWGSVATLRIFHMIWTTLTDSVIVRFMNDVACFWYSFYCIFESVNLQPSKLDSSEHSMQFGQIVPILLLSSTVFVFKEAYDG